MTRPRPYIDSTGYEHDPNLDLFDSIEESKSEEDREDAEES